MFIVNIGERVRGLRKSLGMTQQELASKSGIKQPSLSYIENNPSSEIKQATLLALAKALSTNPQYLSTGKGSPSPVATTTPDESEAVTIFNLLNDRNRHAWMTSGRTLLASQNDVPAIADPYKKLPKVSN